MSKQPKSGTKPKRKTGMAKVVPLHGGVGGDGVQLVQRVAALETNFGNLFKAVEHNTKVFFDAIQAHDVMSQVLQRVLHDMRRGSVAHGTSDGIDFQSYIAEFYAVMGFAQFLGAYKKMQERAVTDRPEEDENTNVVVFGGSGAPTQPLVG